MINEKLKDKFPLNYNYFETMLDLVKQNKRKFPQALIFEGNDIINQYLFALELARNLNCQNDGNFDCECLNCKWIKNHTHPCVNNVSQIHYKDDDDTTKTQISIKQARKIENAISLSSDYYRFFIFFSSKGDIRTDNDLYQFKRLGYSDEIDYSIEPLEYKSFNPATLNALLKSVEEPPENTAFIFLTKSKTSILPTIVSRCLTFKFSKPREKENNNELEQLFNNYYKINYENSFDLSMMFSKIIQEKNISLEELLNKFLDYLGEILRQNINNQECILKIKNDINIINHAIKQNGANMSEKNILDGMFLRLARGY